MLLCWLILPNIFSAPQHKLSWGQMLLASSCTPCFDGSGPTLAASPTQGHWSKYFEPCVRLRRALFLLVRILGRLNEVLHKKGSPAWFPLLHVKTFFQALLLHTSVARPQLCGLWSPVSTGPPVLWCPSREANCFYGSLGVSIHFRLYVPCHFLTEGYIQVYKDKKDRGHK